MQTTQFFAFCAKPKHCVVGLVVSIAILIFAVTVNGKCHEDFVLIVVRVGIPDRFGNGVSEELRMC